MKNDKSLVIISILILILALTIKILPLALVILFAIFLWRKHHRPTIEPPKKKPIPQQPEVNYYAIQAGLQELNDTISDKVAIQRETDLRQFKGRNDVTREELLTYMFEQHYWDGAYERRVQMEEIVKYCNLTMDDIEYCIEELKHYKVGNQEFRALAVRNEVEKTIWQETNKQEMSEIQKTINYRNKVNNEVRSIFHELGENGLDDLFPTDCTNDYETEIRQYNYDRWLKMKGITK